MNVHKVVMDACNGQFFYNGCSGNWYVFVGQSINHEVGGGWIEIQLVVLKKTHCQ